MNLLRALIYTSFAVSLHAQVATLTGRITDSSGAVIPQAKIAVRALNTGIGTATATPID